MWQKLAAAVAINDSVTTRTPRDSDSCKLTNTGDSVAGESGFTGASESADDVRAGPVGVAVVCRVIQALVDVWKSG